MASVPADKATKIEAEPVTVPPVIEAKPEVAVVAPVVEAKPVATPAAATPKVEAKPAAKPVAAAPKIVAKAAAKPARKAKKTIAPKAVKAKPIPSPKAAPLAAPKGLKTMTDTVKQVEETMKKATAEFSEKATEALKDVNSRAKAAMMTGVDRHRKQVPTSPRYYQKKRLEGKTHNQAIRALARHLCRVIYQMLKQDRDDEIRES